MLCGDSAPLTLCGDSPARNEGSQVAARLAQERGRGYLSDVDVDLSESFPNILM